MRVNCFIEFCIYLYLLVSEDVPLVEFMYLVFTRMPGGVTVGDLGLCCCIPCLSSVIISLCSLNRTALCWLVDARWFYTDSSPQINVICRSKIAADYSRHLWTCAVVYLEGFIWGSPAFPSVVTLHLVGHTWRPLFWLFTRNIICNVLIGWNCSGD